MISRVRVQQIQALAREKLIDHGRMHLPVRPKEFANDLDILVQPFVPASSDISGFLMQQGNNFMIGYSVAIVNDGFQNFTVAHELGHYFIDDHPLALLAGGQHFSRSGYISKDRYEQEADAFVTELLMPWRLIETLIRHGGGGFETIKAISDACKSSLVASAIRYAQITDECVAVIVSYQGCVEFMTASQPFRQMPDLDWLRKRDTLPPGVPSMRFCNNSEWIRECQLAEEGTLLSAWFPGVKNQEAEEDIVGLGSYGRLLTVLVTKADQTDSEDEEDEEDDYISRWDKGLFRPKR